MRLILILAIMLMGIGYNTQAKVFDSSPITAEASLDVEHTTKIINSKSDVTVIALAPGTLTISILDTGGHEVYAYQGTVKVDDAIFIDTLSPGTYELRADLAGDSNIVQITIK